ncbi:glycosyltransferase [Agrococcus sp. Ld7]|uniref:glycosyltransferase n=1 Tax=Agrococcus sp. Ld7 TaxID=649148 RepID=UPI00386B6146
MHAPLVAVRSSQFTSGILDAPWNPYQGLPLPLQLLLVVLLGLAVIGFVVVSVLIVQGVRERRRQRRAVADAQEQEFLWVYLVPALDEEVTIADSVGRILDVEATNRVMLVIDDGSGDRTPEILADLQTRTPGLQVLRRELPNAQHGKSAALDDAWRYLHEHVLEQRAYRHWSTDRIIVGIVDADGRVAADSPRVLAGAFADERIGGVQSLVRIYNRGHILTWAQHLEFAITAFVYQLGRSRWGTANMGGNGQYMRLAALDDLVVEDSLPTGIERGPWRDRLTEDQDIGVRMMRAGWHGSQTVLTTVDQQGVTDVRRLLRQRIRWAQGAWQTVPTLRSGRELRSALASRIDHLLYLLAPALQTVMGAGFIAALAMLLVGNVAWLGSSPAFIVLFTVISIGPVYAALVVVAPGGAWSPLVALAYLPVYLAYTWLIWPAFTVGLVRELLGVHGWAKTAREPLDANLAGETADAAAIAVGTAVITAITATIVDGSHRERHKRAA